MNIKEGWLSDVNRMASSHCDARPCDEVSLLVVHNISLPPGEFGGDHVSELFTGKLNPNEHPYFADIHQMRVSAHCFIRRSGEVIQYVPFDKRAWHAGVSRFQGRSACNDFSIGIEMEGTDNVAYTDEQYDKLAQISRSLMQTYPDLSLGRIVGHNDIAPGRKTDPGISFDWCRFRQQVQRQTEDE